MRVLRCSRRLGLLVILSLHSATLSYVCADNDRHITSGVVGTVVSTPGCPAINIHNPCPDRPISTEIIVTDSSNKIVARTNSNQRGEFSIPLVPGDYTVSAHAGVGSPKYNLPASEKIQVLDNTRVNVRLAIDSGIR